MENFRDFQIGPDPFGRLWHGQFKYLQTAISIRHSDSVDVCFLLDSAGDSGEAEKMQRVVVLDHAMVREYTKRVGRELNDTWCSRVAYCKLRDMIVNAEDIEKEYLHVSERDLEKYDAEVRKWEEEWLSSHAA
jgi:hypothetical protein